MKIIRWTFLIFFCTITLESNAQTPVKELKAGHEFFISIPDYMNKTIGLNSSASIQFISLVNDVAGFVVEDSKEELKLAEKNFASINEYYDYFIKDFLVDEEQRTISNPAIFKKGENNYLEVDASFFGKESKMVICYYVCIVETKGYYYKILCWSSFKDKEKFKPDFQKIAYSLRE